MDLHYGSWLIQASLRHALRANFRYLSMASSGHESLCFRKLWTIFGSGFIEVNEKRRCQRREKTVNLKTNGGLGCSQEQEDSVVEFEMDLNDVKISLDKSSTLTVLVVSLVNKIDLEGTKRERARPMHWFI